VDHRRAQIFGGSLATRMTERHVMSSAIVPNDIGMIDGEVGCPLVEIVNGVTLGKRSPK